MAEREHYEQFCAERHRRLKERRETEDLAEDDKVKASIAKAAVG
jgi:hypothetical protein